MEHVDILEDPDGAPYPEEVQVMWNHICDLRLFDDNQPTRETVVAALESVAARPAIERLEALATEYERKSRARHRAGLLDTAAVYVSASRAIRKSLERRQA